jgi:hypothetical protein
MSLVARHQQKFQKDPLSGPLNECADKRATDPKTKSRFCKTLANSAKSHRTDQREDDKSIDDNSSSEDATQISEEKPGAVRVGGDTDTLDDTTIIGSSDTAVATPESSRISRIEGAPIIAELVSEENKQRDIDDQVERRVEKRVEEEVRERLDIERCRQVTVQAVPVRKVLGLPRNAWLGFVVTLLVVVGVAITVKLVGGEDTPSGHAPSLNRTTAFNELLASTGEFISEDSEVFSHTETAQYRGLDRLANEDQWYSKYGGSAHISILVERSILFLTTTNLVLPLLSS